MKVRKVKTFIFIPKLKIVLAFLFGCGVATHKELSFDVTYTMDMYGNIKGKTIHL